ncbi:MAG: histidine--tRNA ligase [Rhizobiales bacterium]|nr:histidine--tRNA ligase [Hyphomicrobiales bacterium]
MMSKELRPKARVAKGFRDVGPDEIRGLRSMLATIQQVYEGYGFEPVEQPFIEYTDALGKFLPDQERPNAGVFSFQDEDGQWLSLRYDLTAPLARYVAENTQGQLPTPYRSYRNGWVFRNEKPGPGRFRQFMQFDADTVGSASPAADAEVCMMAADTMEALGIARGQYVMKVNNRKILDGLLQVLGIEGEESAGRKLTVLRAMDKLDKFGAYGVRLLLGKGRKDESGDFTKGADLNDVQIEHVMAVLLNQPYAQTGSQHAVDTSVLESNALYREGFAELDQINALVTAAGYGPDRIRIDPSIVRGLEYYTGPVFECELLIEAKDEDGRTVRFGSVGGGGRYDDLVARFTGQKVPATGFSIGVSRLYSALKLVGQAKEANVLAPVVVLVMDKERQVDYWRMVMTLRAAGIRAEMYMGTAGMKAQMKYADKRGSPLVIIQGSDEKARGEVQIKDLRLGSELAENASREEYASQRLAQQSVPEAELVAAVKKALA